MNLDQEPLVTVDGVEGWRNPKLAPNIDIVDTNGSIRIISEVTEVKSGEEVYLAVEIMNQSPTDWISQGRHSVHISYHWLDSEGNVVVFDGERTRFVESKLQSGQSKEQLVKVVAPSLGGTYKIVMKLVQEGVRWFEAPSFAGEARTITVIADYGNFPQAKAGKLGTLPLQLPAESQTQQPRRRLLHLRNYLRTLRGMLYRLVL